MYIPLNEDRHPERLQSISCKSTVFISVQTCHAMVPPAHRDGTEEVHGCCQRRTVFIWTSFWGWKHGNPKNELCVRHIEIHFATMDCCTPGAGCTCGILKKKGWRTAKANARACLWGPRAAKKMKQGKPTSPSHVYLSELRIFLHVFGSTISSVWVRPPL